MLTNGQTDGHGQFRIHFRFNIDLDYGTLCVDT